MSARNLGRLLFAAVASCVAAALTLGLASAAGASTGEAVPNVAAGDARATPESVTPAIASNIQTAFYYFLDKGLTEVQSAGIVGNFDEESIGVNPTQGQIGGPALGIAQWEQGGRWNTAPGDNVLEFARNRNANPFDLRLQLDFAWYELQTFPGYGLAALKRTTTIVDATTTFMNLFEMPNPQTTHLDVRIQDAQRCFDTYHGTHNQGPEQWPSLAEPGRVTSARGADGRLEVFTSSPDGIWHAWQTQINGTWSAWRNEGGPANAQLSIARNADGRLELFALGSAQMMHKYQLKPSGEWSDWETSFGPTGGDYVVAGSNADGRLEVFASDGNGIAHKYQTGATTWSAWEGFPGGGLPHAKLQLERSPDGRIELFAMNSQAFWHTYQTKPSGGWAAWEKDFGQGGDWFTVDHNTDGRLEVFASSYAGVFHKYETSATAWHAWVPVNGPASAKLSSTRTADGRVEVFSMNGTDAEHIYQTGSNAPYGNWENFGGAGTSVQVVNDADGRMEVFGTSSAGVFHNWQTSPNTWHGWEKLGTGPTVP